MFPRLRWALEVIAGVSAVNALPPQYTVYVYTFLALVFTWETVFALSKREKISSRLIYFREKAGVLMSYLIVAAIGMILAIGYWWGMQKIFAIKQKSATETAEKPTFKISLSPVTYPDELRTFYAKEGTKYHLYVENVAPNSAPVFDFTMNIFFKNVVIRTSGWTLSGSGPGRIRILREDGATVYDDTPTNKNFSITVHQAKRYSKMVNTNMVIFRCDKWPTDTSYAADIIIDASKSFQVTRDQEGTYSVEYYYEINGSTKREIIRGSIPDNKKFYRELQPPQMNPTAPKVEAKPVEIPDLHKLFDKDFPSLLKIGADRKIKAIKGTVETFVTISEKEYQDYQSKSKFLGYFIPLSPHAYGICEYLTDLYKITMKDLEASHELKFGLTTESNLTSSTDLIFSGRIYIYHENFFTLQDLAALEQLYKSKGLSVIFRGNAYLQSAWDSKNK